MDEAIGRGATLPGTVLDPTAGALGVSQQRIVNRDSAEEKRQGRDDESQCQLKLSVGQWRRGFARQGRPTVERQLARQFEEVGMMRARLDNGLGSTWTD
jgi:hypothetical protein